MYFDSTWDAAAASEPDSQFQKFIARLLTATPDTSPVKMEEATAQWEEWLKAYAERINSEIAQGEWVGEDERKEAMRLANPRFVLRQWLLEEIIKKVERDSTSGRRVLAKVMQVS